jgi:hypothetical protein
MIVSKVKASWFCIMGPPTPAIWALSYTIKACSSISDLKVAPPILKRQDIKTVMSCTQDLVSIPFRPLTNDGDWSGGEWGPQETHPPAARSE